MTSTLRSVLSAAALAAAATMAPAAISVSVEFNPVSAQFDPNSGPGYGMFMNLDASGFTTPGHPDNFVKFESADDGNGNHAFGGDAHPGQGGGSGTYLFSTVSELVTTINDPSAWTLTVTDGATGVTRTYSVQVSSPGINGSYLRPIILSIAPGDTVSSTPTVTWTQPPATLPGSEYTDAYAFFYGGDNGNYYGTPSITPADRMWTPNAVLAADNNYAVGVNNSNPGAPDTLVVASSPTPINGAPALASFTTTVTASSFGQSGPVIVPGGPVCGSADFDGDGDIGTDADIEAFFRVLAGGNC